MTVDGDVINGNLNPAMTPAAGVEIDLDRPMAAGSRITLKCGDPPRSYRGFTTSRDDGIYHFSNAVPSVGIEKCNLTVEGPG